ncbi:MAG: rane-spanning protein [Bacillota bacterium]|nr:rane-spanning protein [Bacillota bacterium]
MVNLFLTLIIGLIGGYVFLKLKVPGGMMVGSIVLITLFNINTDVIYMPTVAKTIAQIIAGAFIGSGIEKDDLYRLKYITKPALTLVSGMLILNIITGFLIYLTSPLDLVTALMCSVPGGMSDIPLISADMGADSSKVAVMQFVRMVFGIGVFPSVISKITKSKTYLTDSEDSPERVVSNIKNKKNFILTIIVAALLGVIGKISNIPSATMVFSMFSVIALKLLTGKAYLPKWVRKFAQMMSGAYIGSGIGMNEIIDMKVIILPAFILILSYLVGCFILGKVLNSKFDMPIREAMLASIPAGASDMALISADLGVQSTNLIVLQIIRLVTVISVFPQVIRVFVHLF